VLLAAEKEYEVSTGERIAHWQRRLLARYTRNLALAANELCAGIFDMAVAARGVVDDNYAWDVWEAAGKYPPQKLEAPPMLTSASPATRCGAIPAAYASAAASPAPSAASARSDCGRARKRSSPANGPARSTAPASALIRPKIWWSKTTADS